MPASPPRPKLRKREIALAVGIGALAAFGAGTILSIDDGSGPPAAQARPSEQRSYDVAPFAEVSTVGPQDVVITLGDEHSVRAEGSGEALGQLEAVVENGQLTIRPREGFDGFSWGRFSSATFYVTVPRLEAISLAGSGNISVDRIDAPRFAGQIAGPGDITIADMKVDEADFRIAGSGDIVATGTAGEANVSITGSGEVKAGGLHSRTAEVSVGGSGNVALTVEEQARVAVMGSGDVAIYGPARCTVSRMGSGDVTCSGGTD